MITIKQHHVLSNGKKSAWGLAGRAEMVVNLSTDGIIAYTNALLNVTTGKSVQRKQIKIKLGLST